MPASISEDKVQIRVNSVEHSYSSVTGLSTRYANGVEQRSFTNRYKAKSWVRTPGYKSIVQAHGRLPDNTFDFYQYSLSGGGGRLEEKSQPRPNGWSQTTHWWTGPVGISPQPDSLPFNWTALSLALIGKAKANQWNVPVFIGEGRKTMVMVENTAIKLVLSAKALRAGNIRQASAILNSSHRLTRRRERKFRALYHKDADTAFSRYWLELQYGWKPMLMDLRNAVNTLMDTADRPSSLEGSVKVSRYFMNKSKKTQRVYNGGANNVTVDSEHVFTQKVIERATWKYSIKPGDIPGRFGLLNPLEVAWELVPLSFVADWFLPIGSYLAALDAPMRFTHAGGTYGRKIETLVDIIPVKWSPAGALTGFSGGFSSTRCQRVPMGSIPSASLLKLGLGSGLSATRTVSAIALLQTIFRR